METFAAISFGCMTGVVFEAFIRWRNEMYVGQILCIGNDDVRVIQCQVGRLWKPLVVESIATRRMMVICRSATHTAGGSRHAWY